MDLFSEIGFGTVGIAALLLVGVPTLLWNPRLLICLLAVVTIFPAFFEVNIRIGPINIYPKDLVLVFYGCAAGVIILRRLVTKSNIFDLPENAKGLLIFVSCYIGLHLFYLFAGAYQGVPVKNGIRRFLNYSGFFYFFFPLFFFRDKTQLRNLLVFITTAGVFYLPFYVSFSALTSGFQLAHTSSGTMRLASAGMTLVACALFTLLIWKKEIKYYLLSVSPVVSMIFSGHRSVFLALSVSLLVMFMYTREVVKSLMFVYLGGFVLLFTLLSFEIFTGHSFIDDAVTRGADTFKADNPTTISRLVSISDSVLIFMKKPVAGIGYHYEILPSLFPPEILNRQQREGGMSAEFNVLAPHNFMVRHLSHTGVIGTFLILGIIWLSIRRCLWFIRAGGFYRDCGTFLFCMIVFFVVLALMNTTFIAEGWVFWILCGSSLLFGTDVIRGPELAPESP
jgi:O-antigen ligase